MKTLYLSLITLMFTPAFLRSQCMMFPLSLEQQMANSDVVVEGEIISKSGFETTAGNYIYTHYEIRITKVFKGNVDGDIIDMVEPGGIVGDLCIKINPGVTLETGQIGLFFLGQFTFRDSRDRTLFSTPVYRGYGSAQSVFKYDLHEKKVNGVFMEHSLTDWYDILREETGKTYIEIHPVSEVVLPSLRMVPSITSMIPTTITAGTFAYLTINGSGFGATIGSSKVEFKNANDGGDSWYAATVTHVLTWSDTKIEIRVPTLAGSGQVRVTVSGMSVTSAQSLTIPYSQFDIETAFNGNQTLFKTQLFNNNGMGGYTFRYFTEFNSNTPAKRSFERALTSWRCAIGVNFIVGATTSVDIAAMDGINVIRFDNGDEMPAGVGAYCANYYDCIGGNPVYGTHAAEIDLVFNDALPPGYTWEYGPAVPSSGEIDFESIALHELGHACQLGHVISPPEVMHFSIGPADVKRALSANDIAGATYIQQQSVSNPSYCGRTAMTYYRRIKFVNPLASDVESGDSWAQGYKKLQDALSATAFCADSIYVATGTYYPDEGLFQSNNDQTQRFVLNSPVVLMGGYDATTGVRNLATTPSTLSGDVDNNGTIDGGNSQNIVRMSAAATLDGFFIEAGFADATSGEGKDGAGLYVSASGIIRNCTFRYNVALGSPPTFIGRGGAVYQSGGSPEFTNCLFYGNFATQAATAIYITGNQVKCTNCTIAHNSIVSGVSALKVDNGTHQFKNSIFWNNGTDLVITSPGTMDVSNSIIQSASLPTGASGSNVLFNTDPLFVNTSGTDYSILPCSPALNTGNNTYNNTTIDILGNTRLTGGTIDRGPFESTVGLPSTLVTNTSDSGAGSLRTILADACSGNTITFSPSLMNQTIVLTGLQLTLSKNVTIQGLGINSLTISGDEYRRIFNVNTGVTAMISDLRLIDGNSHEIFGNCIRSFGNLTLQDVRMSSFFGAELPYTLFAKEGTVTFKNQVIVE